MRKDGKRIKNADAEYLVGPHIMAQRVDALNMIELDIPEQPIKDYLNKKRKEGIKLSHLSLIIAAFARTVAEYPMLNRFVVNKTVYARNEFVVGMVVLKGGKMDNGTTSKVNLDPGDTIFEIDRKINEYIEANRKEDGNNATDKLANALLKIPGLLRVGVILFKIMDKFGLLPKAIIDASPFHATMMVSNLASIRTNHIFHHIYNFGTTSLLLTMGNMREIPKRGKDGEVILERCIPFGLVMDERIATGSYFAMAFRSFKKYLANPELLEKPAENVIREAPYRK